MCEEPESSQSDIGGTWDLICPAAGQTPFAAPRTDIERKSKPLKVDYRIVPQHFIVMVLSLLAPKFGSFRIM
jgi:hypothetical protein